MKCFLYIVPLHSEDGCVPHYSQQFNYSGFVVRVEGIFLAQHVFFTDCHLRGTRITLTGTTRLGFMFVC